MTQGPGAASPENSLSPQDESGWTTFTSRKKSKTCTRNESDGHGTDDKLIGHGKNAGGTTKSPTSSTSLSATSPTSKFKKRFLKDYEKIDLHNLRRDEAMEKLKGKIINLQCKMKGDFVQLTIITGKGIHSLGGKPCIKLAVLNHCIQNGIEHKEWDDNPGRIDIIVYKRRNLVT